MQLDAEPLFDGINRILHSSSGPLLTTISLLIFIFGVCAVAAIYIFVEALYYIAIYSAAWFILAAAGVVEPVNYIPVIPFI